MTDGPKPLILDDDADPFFGNTKKTRQNQRVMGVGCPYIKIGKKVAYHPDDIVEWVNAHRFKSTSEKEVA